MDFKNQVGLLTDYAATALNGAFDGSIAKPTQEEAEKAVRTLIRWAGDDPTREGMIDTPKRVLKAYGEFFSGYNDDPVAILQRTFQEVNDYDETIVLRDIRVESHCEHHMLPIIGRAHVAYLPRKRVVGISKLARIVEMFARRFQVQEKLTAQIADTINQVLQPKGVAVVVEAMHHCMTTRGVHKTGTLLVTSRMIGAYRSDMVLRREFLETVGNNRVAATN